MTLQRDARAAMYILYLSSYPFFLAAYVYEEVAYDQFFPGHIISQLMSACDNGKFFYMLSEFVGVRPRVPNHLQLCMHVRKCSTVSRVTRSQLGACHVHQIFLIKTNFQILSISGRSQVYKLMKIIFKKITSQLRQMRLRSIALLLEGVMID